jgi:ribulose kinase
LAHQGGFNANFFHQIGLSELAEENFQRIGQSIRQIGQPVGSGLAEEAAIQMGLKKVVALEGKGGN